jgi:hypothetical protein
MSELKAVINVLTETLIDRRNMQSSMTMESNPQTFPYLQGQIDMLESVISAVVKTFKEESSTLNSH